MPPLSSAATWLILGYAFAVVAAYNPDTTHQDVQVLHRDAPRLYRVSNFLSDHEMDHIINASFQHLRSSKLYGPETGMHYELPIYGDPVLEHIERRLLSIIPGLGKTERSQARLEDESSDTGEVFYVRRYLEDGLSSSCKGGDRFHKHEDYIDDGSGDKLLVSMTMYLSSPEDGGQTRFEAAHGGKGYDYSAWRGDLGIWWSCTRDGRRDMKSTHWGVPLKKGIKWIATRFLYDSTLKCDWPVRDKVKVPTAALHNVPQRSSADTLFGAQLPNGVVHAPDCSLDALKTSDIPFNNFNKELSSMIKRNKEIEEKMAAKLEEDGFDWEPDL